MKILQVVDQLKPTVVTMVITLTIKEYEQLIKEIHRLEEEDGSIIPLAHSLYHGTQILNQIRIKYNDQLHRRENESD